MLIKRPRDIPSSEITSESAWINRRDFIDRAVKVAVAGAAIGLPACGDSAESQARPGKPLTYEKATSAEAGEGFYTSEQIAPYYDVTHYNNFYEFGTDKTDPASNAANFRTEPWTVVIDGEVEKPGKRGLEDILAAYDLEERIYRLRCVEAWSMVVPWIGIPLAALLKQHRPTSRAKYVAFTTLYDPSRMPAQRSRTSIVDWPYVEGLRMDEAMHPLTLMTVGLYGKTLPGQNGAPIRLIVPWKYGFKCIKSIVRISLVERQPPTTWSTIAPDEYGFYANVNPHVDHPRWSQAYERRLPSTLFSPNRIKTRMFNGYAEEVAHLYAGMDLKKYF